MKSKKLLLLYCSLIVALLFLLCPVLVLAESSATFDNSKGIPFLSYHRVEPVGNEATIISIEKFSEQMQYLHDNGYTTITYDDFYQWRQGNFQMPEKPVLIVFDDGWLSAYQNAYPIMQRYGFVGVNNIITQYASNPDVRYSNFYMNWQQINDLKNSGWQIASHSYSHVRMTTLNSTDRAFQFSKSKQDIIDNTGVTPTLFTFPYDLDSDSLDTECSQYYLMCSSYSRNYKIPGNYNYKDSNLIYRNQNGLKRAIVSNDTTMEQFSKMLGENKPNPNIQSYQQEQIYNSNNQVPVLNNNVLIQNKAKPKQTSLFLNNMNLLMLIFVGVLLLSTLILLIWIVKAKRI